VRREKEGEERLLQRHPSHRNHDASTYPMNPIRKQHFRPGRIAASELDVIRQTSQRHPGGGSICAQRQYHSSYCISPSDRSFAVSSRSGGLKF